MGAIYDALESLSPAEDAELADGYERYEALLSEVLTPQQLATYADYIREAGELRVFEAMAPEELAALSTEQNVVALSIVADQLASMENRRVAALLNQRGEGAVAPDLDTHRDERAAAI
jgi:hypothetical protein